MAQFFSTKRKPKKQAKHNLPQLELSIEAMDHHGNGLCLSHKPIVVIEGGFLGERYQVQIVQQKSNVWHGQILAVLQANNEARQEPFCPHINECGGCSHQHIKPEFLLTEKQKSLRSYLDTSIEDTRLSDAIWDNPLGSTLLSIEPHQAIAYRRRARLAIDARDTKNPKIGFRKAKTNKVVDINSCAVLSKGLQACYSALVATLKELPDLASVGHVTLTEGQNTLQVCLHLTKNLHASSVEHLRSLIARKQSKPLNIVTQLKHSELRPILESSTTVEQSDSQKLNVSPGLLAISDQANLTIWVSPNQFLQVNQSVNEQMLRKADEWLSTDGTEYLIDLFAGVGNFGLALSSSVKAVNAFEGIASMVQQGEENALKNGIDNISFHHVDLSDSKLLEQIIFPENSVLIVDPSRDGAFELMKQIDTSYKKTKKSRLNTIPDKILYVSCNPTSFARDVAALPKSYKVKRFCALDMFPYTKHIELMALIERI